MNKQDRTHVFEVKNNRRRTHRNDPGAGGARELRKLGVSTQIKTTIPTEIGEDIVVKEEVQGVPGAFGWATKAEWNELVVGTSGAER